ncbi:MAG: substrate-binding domain-containing protein, partial [Thermoplasmata archaeon]
MAEERKYITGGTHVSEEDFLRQLKEKTVDFGGTDAFLSDQQIKEMGADIVHIPVCMGAVVLAYNMPGIKTLYLTPDIVADMF